MSLNSASSFSNGLLASNHTSVFFISSIEYHINCVMSKPTSTIFTALKIIQIFIVLPLFVFVYYYGLQQWWQRRSTSSAATVNHSDCFTYHAVAVELVGVSGMIFSLLGIHTEEVNVLLVGTFISYFTWFGEMLFHILTCLEHYLAVVHPLTYMSLRNERGIRIRNVIISCVWLSSFAGTGSVMIGSIVLFIGVSLLILAFLIVLFSSVSVLYVLIQPAPGEQGGGRKKFDQSKQRALCTIVAILGVMMSKVVYGLVWAALSTSEKTEDCVIIVCDIWFNLPSSLVLPLLFACRAGKLMCWKKNIPSVNQ